MAYDIKFIDIPNILSPSSLFIEKISYIGSLFILIIFKI